MSHTRTRGTRGTRVETFWSLLLSLVSRRGPGPLEDGDPPRVPRVPRELRERSLDPAAAYWTRLLPAVYLGWPVCIEVPGFHHHGQLDRLRIHPGGACTIRFADGVEALLPAQRGGG